MENRSCVIASPILVLPGLLLRRQRQLRLAQGESLVVATLLELMEPVLSNGRHPNQPLFRCKRGRFFPYKIGYVKRKKLAVFPKFWAFFLCKFANIMTKNSLLADFLTEKVLYLYEFFVMLTENCIPESRVWSGTVFLSGQISGQLDIWQTKPDIRPNTSYQKCRISGATLFTTWFIF